MLIPLSAIDDPRPSRTWVNLYRVTWWLTAGLVLLAFVVPPLNFSAGASVSLGTRVGNAFAVLLLQNVVLALLLLGGHVTQLLERVVGVDEPEAGMDALESRANPGPPQPPEIVVVPPPEWRSAAEAMASARRVTPRVERRFLNEVLEPVRGAWTVAAHRRSGLIAIAESGLVVVTADEVIRAAWSGVNDVAVEQSDTVGLTFGQELRWFVLFRRPEELWQFVAGFNESAANAGSEVRV